MKAKILAFFAIAIVLCSLFLVAMPAIAAEQNTQKERVSAITASEDDFVLGVYGNANEDDTIDMRDLTYVKLIFFGERPETELADAKYDAEINPLDFVQIKLIIVGKENELTLVCDPPNGKDVTINKPVKRVVVLTPDSAEALGAINAGSKVVGISTYLASMKIAFPELSKLPTVGSCSDPDCEAIISLNPDIVITYGKSPSPNKLDDKLQNTNIAVVRLDCWKPEHITEDVKKLGYIFEKEKEANELINFQKRYLDIINDGIEKLSEDEKPRGYLEGYGDYSTWSKGWGIHYLCIMAGGKNIAADLSGTHPKVDSEWVLEQNPDIIVKVTRSSIAGYEVDDPSEIKALRDKIMSCPGWSNITAGKSESVYTMSRDICYGTDYIVALTYLAKWFHPDLFEGLDPQVIHQEYLTAFQGLDYDLDKHGVFVYHPELHPHGS
jgi:iron complex transport system substrate-binding protein